MSERGWQRWVAITLVAGSMLVAPAAVAQEQGVAELRFVHAAPGAGSAVLNVDDDPAGEPVAYGEVGEYVDAPSGRVRLTVRAEGGGRELGGGTGELGPGRHTAVAWLRGGRFELSVIDDASATEGRARLRAVNAAGELGRALFRLDSQTLGEALGPGEATPYEAVDPGSYEVQATRATGGGAPLAERSVRLAAGTSSTAFILGSGGEPVEIVVASDATAAPERAPETGLGGLDSDTPWLVLALVALAAGALGGGAYRLGARGSRQ
jgi:hypothetical protein